MKNEIFTKGLEMALWHYSGAYFCLPVVFLLAGSLKGTKELTDSLGAVIAGKGGRLTVELFSGISNTSPLREGSV